jgi:hypothetical protein
VQHRVVIVVWCCRGEVGRPSSSHIWCASRLVPVVQLTTCPSLLVSTPWPCLVLALAGVFGPFAAVWCAGSRGTCCFPPSHLYSIHFRLTLSLVPSTPQLYVQVGAGFAACGSAFCVLQVPISPTWLQTCDLCVLAGLACLWMHSPVVLPMHSWRAIVWQLIDRHSVVWC